jgi:hypothetical protein
MEDPHQINTVIATVICDFFRDRSGEQIGIEEAKLLGKQIVQALGDAGLQITVIDQPTTR